MAKVACYAPDGEMKMKEPVDARECVENCGFTMEAPESVCNEALPIDTPVVDVKPEVIDTTPKVDGRKTRHKRNR